MRVAGPEVAEGRALFTGPKLLRAGALFTGPQLLGPKPIHGPEVAGGRALFTGPKLLGPGPQLLRGEPYSRARSCRGSGPQEFPEKSRHCGAYTIN